MEYLNDSQIIEQVFYYLNEDIYNYAIMLNGAWGSGKTYFVKEILLPQLKKQGIERKPIYLSLYGLKSNDEIAAAMLTSIIELRMGKMKKCYLSCVVGQIY